MALARAQQPRRGAMHWRRMAFRAFAGPTSAGTRALRGPMRLGVPAPAAPPRPHPGRRRCRPVEEILGSRVRPDVSDPLQLRLTAAGPPAAALSAPPSSLAPPRCPSWCRAAGRAARSLPTPSPGCPLRRHWGGFWRDPPPSYNKLSPRWIGHWRPLSGALTGHPPQPGGFPPVVWPSSRLVLSPPGTSARSPGGPFRPAPRGPLPRARATWRGSRPAGACEALPVTKPPLRRCGRQLGQARRVTPHVERGKRMPQQPVLPAQPRRRSLERLEAEIVKAEADRGRWADRAAGLRARRRTTAPSWPWCRSSRAAWSCWASRARCCWRATPARRARTRGRVTCRTTRPRLTCRRPCRPGRGDRQGRGALRDLPPRARGTAPRARRAAAAGAAEPGQEELAELRVRRDRLRRHL